MSAPGCVQREGARTARTARSAEGAPLSDTDALLARTAAFAREVVMPGAARWEAERRIAREAIITAAALIEAGSDAQLAAAQAKLFATRLAERQLPVLARAMGAEGLRESHPFGRHLAGARVASFVDGSSEMLLERIAALA